MQTCTNCQHESPLGAKFCRQCGAPLFAASEFSEAQTRNYGRQGSAVVSSGPLPPSVADVLGADTARQYQPPAVAPAPAPPSINTAPIKKKFAPWTLLAVMLALLIGLALGALLKVSYREDSPLPPEELARQSAERDAEMQQEIQERIRQEIQERISATQEQARQLAEQAGSPGPALATTEKLLDLSPYEFPGSTVGSYIRIPGSEMLIIRTYNNFEAIKQFYQKKLGPPLMQINEEDDQVLIFQSTEQAEGQKGAPPVMVNVEKDDNDENQFKIIITRAPHSLTKN